MTKYTIGVDFGSLSARAVLVDITNGDVVSSAVRDYPHAVMTATLPDGTTTLGRDWALQHPQDYVDCLIQTVREAVQTSDVAKEDIIGLSVDFTACTVLPIQADGTPLCFLPEFEREPHAWVKLWKHHAAQYEADKINALAAERGESFLARYGNKISSEWLFPKLLQILDEAPHIYHEMDRFIEATDWITWQMTGVEKRNSCTAGYKAMWNDREGFPDKAYFKALHPQFENVVEEKLGTEYVAVGTKAGTLLPEMAEKMGLLPSVVIAVGNVDAHVSVASTGVVDAGTMLNIMGTSTCDITLATKEVNVPGMCGVVRDGAVPGFYAYESGQNAVGDIFGWFVDNCVPETYYKEAASLGMNIHQLLEQKASALKPGESGLLALDWWNGNRSILVDTDLTGMILGMTLQTKPEEMYRALIEATAFGKRLVIDQLEAHGIAVERLTVCGGLPHKNQLLNQIYVDITNKEMTIAEQLHAPAVGAAVFAAVAAGAYPSLQEAAKQMAHVRDEKVTPIAANQAVYEKLYAEYKLLHDYFGRGENDVMKRLKSLKTAYAEEALQC
ncbi:ribulokinase [Kurthia massiliensis]|uniref:ribulokinase n=1 Tax=Kurthia massiliensis TaxID=1033739 RepID=UPI0002892C4B